MKRDFEDAVFAPSGVLSDERVENLSSVGFIDRLNELERVVGVDWPWFGQYGDELLKELKKLNIPPMQPKPPKKRAKKRVHDLEDDQEQHVTKKKRDQNQIAPTQNPTPIAVTANPALPYFAHVTHNSTTPVPVANPHSYATQQYYATPQRPLLPYNPYHFMTYPYTIPPAPPFYGYFQKPIQPAVPNSYTLHKFSE